MGLYWIGGGVRSVAAAVSADGSVVVGFKRDGLDEAVKWQAGEMIPLGKLDLAGDDRSLARAVSPDGTIVAGESTGTEDRSVAVIWRDGGPIERPPSEGLISVTPLAVTNSGNTVVAYAHGADGRFHVVRWGDGTHEVVSPPKSGQNWRPAGASSDGETIAGHIAGEPNQAFVWKDGETTLLGWVGDEPGSMANAISADGTVVVGRSGAGTAFRWHAGKMTDLGKLDGYDQCAARAVSRGGERIAGNCWRTAPARARPRKGPSGSSVVFVWDREHGMRSLGDILAAAGKLANPWALTECHGISADGVTLVGNGHSATQSQEAWLAVLPVGQ